MNRFLHHVRRAVSGLSNLIYQTQANATTEKEDENISDGQ